MKFLKFSFASIFVVFMLPGCETMRGVESRKKPFTKIADKTCVNEAIKSVEGVRYIDSFTKDDDSKSWKNESISRKVHYFLYEIPELSNIEVSGQEGKGPRSQIIITEEKSSNPRFNSTSYYHSFGHMNGKDYSDYEKERAKQFIKEIDASVVDQCNLDISLPQPTEI